MTNTNDSGVGSLRNALADAGVGDTIQFGMSASSIITVATELNVSNPLTIDGSTATNLKISGGNTTHKSGTISGGANDITDIDASFVNPAADNYHLQLTSPAIDAGTSVGVTTDLDGVVRPQSNGFDIGAYEIFVKRLFLPLILR